MLGSGLHFAWCTFHFYGTNVGHKFDFYGTNVGHIIIFCLFSNRLSCFLRIKHFRILSFSLNWTTGQTGCVCYLNRFPLFHLIQCIHSGCNKCPEVLIELDKEHSWEKKRVNAIIFPLVPDRMREACAGLFF